MRQRVALFALAAGIVVLDRVTKLWIQASVSLHETHTVIPGVFDIVHTENRGMAFGLFNDGDSFLRRFLLVAVALVVLLVVARILWRLPASDVRDHRFTQLSLALILGGAVGNFYDRLLRGSVTDFLDFYVGDYHWPSFNVADSAITVGAALLALDLLTGRRRQED